MKYILIVDDSPTIRTSVQFSVVSLGHQIQQAENGADAIEKAAQLKKNGHELALCIVDVNMPVMDGISFVKEFRKNDKFTPVMILTTESEEGKINEGKLAGASGWMIKPFKPDELLATVKRLIR